MKAVLALLLIFSGLEVAYLVLTGKLPPPAAGSSTGGQAATTTGGGVIPELPSTTPPLPDNSKYMFMSSIAPGASSGYPTGGIQL